MKKIRPIARVIVEPIGNRKGWHWRQVTGNGATAAVSPKSYDTKALAHRAGRRQVEVLNYPYAAVLPTGETPVLPGYAAALVISE